MENNLFKVYSFGIIGSILLFYIGWEFNIPLVPFVSFPLLIFSFRKIKKWYMTLPIILVMIITRYVSIVGGWDIEPLMMLGFAFIVLTPIICALYIDRYYLNRLSPLIHSLIFPCTYIILDYFVTYANLGMTFSLTYSQSTFLEFIQGASLLGSWFVGFMVAWFAPNVLLLINNYKSLELVKIPLIIYFAILTLVISYGSFRLVYNRPNSDNVRIASITVEHDKDYWLITDNRTPKNEAEEHKPDMEAIQDELFTLSKKAADYGSKIIFWSEGNLPIYEDDYDDFISKAKKFAKDNEVYLIPSGVVLLYDRTKNDNISIIINPEGEVLYRYEKSISWYPTDSDGIIPIIETPYGRIALAICFDMDYPTLISQASESDIMLVPAFDTKKIANFHTRVSFIRGIENGFSVIRQANEGASISADYLGNTLTYQNYFFTDERIMISDVPTRGVNTLYGMTKEIFLWSVFAGFIVINGLYIKRRLKNKS